MIKSVDLHIYGSAINVSIRVATVATRFGYITINALGSFVFTPEPLRLAVLSVSLQRVENCGLIYTVVVNTISTTTTATTT